MPAAATTGVLEHPAPPDDPLRRPSGARSPTLADRLSRSAFRYGNRYLMTPFHRAGLAAWLGNPLTGCQLLLTTTGRRSGRPRSTPLGYVLADGSAWVLAGYGPSTLWLGNLRQDPAARVRLPGRPPVAVTATVVEDPLTRARIVPDLIRSMPLPGCMIGTVVWTATDSRLLELVGWVPLVRLTPVERPLVAGPDDPGGQGWVWRQALLGALSLAGALGVRRVARARAAALSRASGRSR